MNLRIKELLEQADIYFTVDNKAVAIHRQEISTNDVTNKDLEKFAELVVRECAEWMRDGNIPDGFYEADRLLEHFGFKE